MYDRLVVAPGEALSLGTEGGVLILQRPGLTPGQMSLYDLQCRALHLLREDGPDTGYPLPTNGDFTAAVIQRDLNIALAQFISDSGVAPALSERQDTLPVFAVLDHPVPPGLVSLTRIEYTTYGQGTYVLTPLSFGDFDRATGGWITNVQVNRPYVYRQPFAGYVRLQPQPTTANQVGVGVGFLTFTGTPEAGQVVTATLSNPPTTVAPTYTVQSGDTTESVAFGISNAINASNAVVGPSPFLAPSSVSGNQVQVNGLEPPGSAITYAVSVTTGTLSVAPTSTTTLTPTGDTMTWYYTSMGTALVNPGDTPGIPPQFQMALVYRVLMDYWRRKQDLMQAKEYERMYLADVARGKAFTYDSNRATQPTISSGELQGDVVDWGSF